MTGPAENQRRITQAAAWLLKGQSTQHVVTRLLQRNQRQAYLFRCLQRERSQTHQCSNKGSIIKTYLPRGPQALSKFLVLPNQTETSHQEEQAL